MFIMCQELHKAPGIGGGNNQLGLCLYKTFHPKWSNTQLNKQLQYNDKYNESESLGFK